MMAALLAGVAGMALLQPVGGLAQEEGHRKVRVQVQPLYPDLAKRLRLSGTVKIEVAIAPNGTLKSAKTIGGNPVLIEAAMDALKKWKWETGSDVTTQIIAFHFVPQ
jgi:TonB family protein